MNNLNKRDKVWYGNIRLSLLITENSANTEIILIVLRPFAALRGLVFKLPILNRENIPPIFSKKRFEIVVDCNLKNRNWSARCKHEGLKVGIIRKLMKVPSKFFQILPRVYTFSTSIRHNPVYIVSNKTNTQPIRVRYIIKICHVTVSSMVER